MSGKKNWGSLRMDGHIPPPIEEPVDRATKTKKRRGRCPKTKEKHQYELSIPDYRNKDRVGRFLNLTVDEFYEKVDAEALANQERRSKSTSTITGWFWPYQRTRYWRCIACNKLDQDSEENPDRKIRNQTLV